MESRNPVFSRSEEFKRGGYATFDAPSRSSAGATSTTTAAMSATDLQNMYSAPSATPLQTGRMTLDDVVVRTALVFGTLLVTAAATFFVISPQNLSLIIVALIVGLVLGLVNSFKKTPSPALILAYAGVEGVVVGGISAFYEARWNGIVVQAVLGTLAAFATMLALYRTGRVRNSPKFQRVLIISGFGYLAFGLVHLMGVGLGWWPSVYSSGLLGVVISAAGVVLASFYLVLDFDYIEQGIRNGVPQRFAWTAAFGLVVTLVWLYLEILRLIAILRGND